eukprot:TRINITY_DN73671_c0_g1_i1.p1 TRINITY_DN73671_c0_g1~~TRINITY_DN73671_c0_g1_i1.p1  ORF type:complete len:1697 (+),score=372.53 TRINITY_DN73671_c0_g1_i1:89-5179(+)
MAVNNARWVPHAEEVAIPGSIEKQDENETTFKLGNGEVVKVPTKEAAEYEAVYDDQVSGIEDVCSLGSATKGALIHTVRMRYSRREIYTKVAKTVISLNPFASLPLYSADIMQQYAASQGSHEMPPHVFGVGQDAMKGVQNDGRNQAVLISGESGAGKTEAAKLIMSYVGGVAKSNEENVMKKVMQTNPILEAFGNAQTVRNSNSSRFGKWIDLRFTKSFVSSGASVTQYLLEKTRVCHQAEKERNFHIFFQLLQARDTPEFKDMGLETPKKYRYLKDGQEKARNVDDAECFAEINLAFTDVGLSRETQTQIWSIVAGVLVLGNGDFKEDGDGSAVSNQPVFDKAAKLLGVDVSALTDVLLYRMITVGRDTTKAKNRPDQACNIRDTTARLIYGLLFRWLVSSMSEAMASEEDAPHLIGVLDIAGFECFEINVFEQLHINLSNEYLQQQFNSQVVKSEIDECKKEGVQFPDIGGFLDNADVLALIADKGGVLEILDEVCATSFSNAKEESYVQKVGAAHKSHPCFLMPKIATKPPTFTIKHFAGPVKYTVADWLERNTEKLPDEVTALLGTSSFELLHSMKDILVADDPPEGQKSKKKKSVSGNFRSNLKDLMVKINAAAPHYIRCVKPNPQHVPGRIVSTLVMEQMLFAGVLAAITIRQQGYAFRLLHKEFNFVYGCIVNLSQDPKLVSKSQEFKNASNDKDRASALLAGMPDAVKALGLVLDDASFAIGFTKVFIRFAAYAILDKARAMTLKTCVTKICKVYRGIRARTRVKRIREAMDNIKKITARCGDTWTRSQGALGLRQRRGTMDVDEGQDSIMTCVGGVEPTMALHKELDDAITAAESVGARNSTLDHAEWIARRIMREVKQYQKIESMSISIDPVTMEAALHIATSLNLPTFEGSAVLTLQRRLSNLKVQLPMIKDLEAATKLNEIVPNETKEKMKQKLEQLEAVLKAAQEAGLSSDPKVWEAGLNGPSLFDQVDDLVTRQKKAIEKAVAEEAAKAAAEAADQAAKAAAEAAAQAAAEGATEAAKDAAKAAAKAANDAAEVAAKAGQASEEATQTTPRAPPLRPHLKSYLGAAADRAQVGHEVFLAHQEAEREAAGAAARKRAEEEVRHGPRGRVFSRMPDNISETFRTAIEDSEKRLADRMAAERAKTAEQFMELLKAETSRIKIDGEAGAFAMAEAMKELTRSIEEAHAQTQADFDEQSMSIIKKLSEKEVVSAIAAEGNMDGEEANEKDLAEQLAKEKETVERLKLEIEQERQKAEKRFQEALERQRGNVQETFHRKKASFASDVQSPQKPTARNMQRRRTIPGLVVSERSQIVEKLSVAVAAYNLDALEMLLARVVEECIEDEVENGPVSAAKEFFSDCQTEAFLVKELARAVEDSRHANVNTAQLWKLHRIHEQLGKILKNKFHGEYLQALCSEASELLQTKLTARAKSAGLKSILKSKDAEEKSLAESVFGNMTRFYRLKVGTSWNTGLLATTTPRKSLAGAMSRRSTAVRSSFFEAGNLPLLAARQPDILEYSDEAIDESLTKPRKSKDAETHDTAAVTSFLNIMLYMNTKPTSKTQKESCVTAVVNEAAKSCALGEETILQVVKQLNGNDSNWAIKLGWELLARLLAEVPPSAELSEFVRVFIQEKEEDLLEEEETEAWAKAILPKCRDALDKGSRGGVADASKILSGAWEGVSWMWGQK